MRPSPPMLRDRPCRRFVAVLLAAAITLSSAGVATADESPPSAWRAAVVQSVADAVRAIDASERFLADYVDPNGRVVRRDQGGDTVSEGQAYAMLIAAAIGDEPTFRRVWRWTEAELRRPDGLFAWHWADGSVVDRESAADADLYIAGALSLAAQEFDDDDLAAAARATSDAILRHETITVGDQRMLAAGTWAVDARVFNASYAATPIMSRLWSDGGWSWGGVADGSRRAIEQLTADAPHLPPDWATISTDARGALSATAVGRPPRYGWDAVRVPVQLATDCDPAGRRIAARMWPFFLTRAVVVAAAYTVGGEPLVPSTHAVAIVGAAGAAQAAGATTSADVLLARATSWDEGHPTYYGSAWIALGRLWLTTSLLGGCADAGALRRSNPHHQLGSGTKLIRRAAP